MRERGRSNQHRLFGENAENRKKTEGASLFSEDLQTSILPVLLNCSIGVQNQNERPKSEYNSSPLRNKVISGLCFYQV